MASSAQRGIQPRRNQQYLRMKLADFRECFGEPRRATIALANLIELSFVSPTLAR